MKNAGRNTNKLKLDTKTLNREQLQNAKKKKKKKKA